MRGRGTDGWIDDYAYTINCINSVLFLPICVVVGYFTDKLGTMPFLCVSAIIVTFVSPFLFYGLSISESSMMNWFLQFLLILSCVPIWGCIFFWYINTLLPDPRTRVTIYGVGYNLGAALFGGTASLIGTAFVSSMGSINGMIWSGVWMSIMAVLCIGCVSFIEFCEKQPNGPVSFQAKFMGKSENAFNSTWYLNSKYKQLDTINEEANCEYSSSDEPFKSPKVYG
eukprot:UN04994